MPATQPLHTKHYVLHVARLSELPVSKLRQLEQFLRSGFGDNVELLGDQYWFEDEQGRIVFTLNIVEEQLPDLDTLATRRAPEHDHRLRVPRRGSIIYNVCLDPALRGKRLSNLLLRYVLRENLAPRDQPEIEEVFLKVLVGNQAAIRLYRRLGFEVVDTVLDDTEPFDLMRLALASCKQP